MLTFKIRRWPLYMVVALVLTIASSCFLVYKIAGKAIYYAPADQSPKTRDNAALFAGMCLFSGLNYVWQRFIVFSGK